VGILPGGVSETPTPPDQPEPEPDAETAYVKKHETAAETRRVMLLRLDTEIAKTPPRKPSGLS
jgi:hypothetical protein